MSSNYFQNLQTDPNNFSSFEQNNYLSESRQTLDYSNPNLPSDVRFAYNKDREPNYFVTYALDVLSRGQYASAAFTDTIISQGLSALPSALYNAASEGINPQARLSYTDILNRYAPDFAKNNPYGAFALGLGLDIVLDPITYLGVGLIGKGKKIGTTVVNEVGEKVFKKVLDDELKRIAIDFGDDAARVFEKKMGSLLTRSNQSLIANQSAEKVFQNILSNPEYAANKLSQLGLDDLIGKQLSKEKGFRLFVGLGKKELDLPAYKIIDPILETTGLKRVNEKVSTFINGFSKIQDYKGALPGSDLIKINDELKENLLFFENNLSNINVDLIEDFKDIFKNVNKQDIEIKKVIEAYASIDKAKSSYKSVRGFLTADDEIALTKDAISVANLNPNEIQVLARLNQKYNDLNFVETGVDNLIESVNLFAQSKEANALVSNVDDFIRFKQALLDGTATSFVAESKDLQFKLSSKEFLAEKLGKSQKIGNENIELGRTVLDLTNENILDYAKKNKFTDNFLVALKDKSAIISGIGAETDIQKFGRLLNTKGFNLLTEAETKAIGDITDSAKRTLKQFVFTKKDGSIIRVTQENIKPNVVKFNIIKGVSAPNVNFNTNILGTQKLENIAIEEIPNITKVIKDEVVLDPLGTVIQNKADGGSFAAMYQKALDDGVDINTMALNLYTQRAMKVTKEQSQRAFKSAIQINYGVDKFDDLPKYVKERITYIGEGLYNGQTSESMNKLLKVYDKALNLFKFQVTAFNPSFAPRQTIQNPVQYALFTGKNPLDIFINKNPLPKADPRALTEAAFITANVAPNSFTTQMPDFVRNNLLQINEKAPAFQAIDILKNTENIDNLSNIKISNPFGQVMTGAEFYDAAKKLGLTKGSSTDISFLQRDAEKELSRFLSNVKDKDGVMSFFKDNLKYWNYPSKVEDFFKMAYLINGWRSGMNLKDSAKMVEKALFNYQTGLTQFETRVLKRIIPFYTFQRNAIPALVQTAFNAPGRIATAYKVQEKFFDVWNKLNGGQELTPFERQISPDFIFEQSSVYAGKDEKGRLVYNTFNTLTPFDAINLVQFDKVNGGIDFPATLKKIVMNSLSPFIKMTVELGMNRLMFSDRLLDESDKVGGVGIVLDKLPQPLKNMIGFEKGVDPVSGKEKFYVSPYQAYVAGSFFPAINNIVRPLDPEKTISESVRSLILGSQTYKYDKTELESAYGLTTAREIREIKGKINKAAIENRPNKMEMELKRLENFLRVLDDENSYKNPLKPF